MKNQYFGDINDYRKYGILRVMSKRFSIAMCWMLTSDDGTLDGGNIRYLYNNDDKKFDNDLYCILHNSVIINKERKVCIAQKSNLIDNAVYHSEFLQNSILKRKEYFDHLKLLSQNSNLLFFDPDIGIEIPTVHYGQSRSNMYLFWKEIETCYSWGKSILIYQHFPRVARDEFITCRACNIKKHTKTDCIVSFQTSTVVFFLVLQPSHIDMACKLSCEISNGNWKNKITVKVHQQYIIGIKCLYCRNASKGVPIGLLDQ